MDNSSEKAVVTVRNAYKTYDGKTFVLRGLNMSAKQGTIYGLLGSSGCGKSTLLNAIIGLVGLNRGTIELSITQKCDLGFMPQGLCLYEQFTVGELLSYFGTMYGMSPEYKQSRIDLVYKILELPDKNRCIPNLSGGQKRRVSLAIALIHDPKLLILDEPTVGVDPVLRQRIWDFLMEWSQTTGRTIIITTHYIEETVQANTVALMREGVMLCEKSPQSIMADCNTEYLEDAFLKLSQAQTTRVISITSTEVNDARQDGSAQTETSLLEAVKRNDDGQMTSTQQDNEEEDEEPEISDLPLDDKHLKYSSLSHVKESFKRSRFLAEVRKNVIFLWRNMSVALFILCIPSLSIGLFDVALGRDPEGLHVSIVNDELPSGVQICDNYIYGRKDCHLNYLSCHYLKLLEERSLNLAHFHDVPEAIDKMNRSHSWATIYFNRNFTTALVQRIIEPTLQNDDLIDNSTLIVYIDRSNTIILEILKEKMRQTYLDMVRQVINACNYSDILVNIPMKFEKPIFGKSTPSFREFAGPALMMIIMFGMPLTYGVVIVVEEKNSGATSRSLVAGTSLFEVFAAHAVVQVAVQLFHTVTCIILMYGILQYPFQQPSLTTLLLLLHGFAGMAFAFAISVSFSSITLVAIIGTGFTIASTMIGGLMWPIEGMHPYFKVVSWLTPSTFPGQALRSLTLRGWSLLHKDVYLGFFASSCWIALFALYTFIYVKQKKNKVFVSQKIG